MFGNLDINFTKLFYSYSTQIIFFLYFILLVCVLLDRIGYFGQITDEFENKVKSAVVEIQYWIKFYVSLFLIIVYNPFIKLTQSNIDAIERKIIFNSGVIILLSLLLIDPSNLI